MDTPLHRAGHARGGVVLLSDARRLGLSSRTFSSLARSEDWTRLERGAYLLPGVATSLEGRLRAAHAKRPSLVASHRSAAALHGFEGVEPRLEMTGPVGSRFDVGGSTHRLRLDPGDVVEVAGLPLTTPLRTACDLLRTSPRDEAVVAVDSALRRGLVTLDAIADSLRGMRGSKGIVQAWRGFARLDPKSGSVLESRARLEFFDGGIYPCSQVVLIATSGRRVIADFVIGVERLADSDPTLRILVLEVEGREVHGTREGHQYDVSRFNDLSRLDPRFVVLRFTWDDIVLRPRTVLRVIRDTMASLGL